MEFLRRFNEFFRRFVMKEYKSQKTPEHTHHQPEPTPTPAPAPAPEPGALEGEKKLKVRAKSQVSVDGVIHNTGDVFELPERQALSLVGTGAAEELPEE
jgi:hypothetical protein